MIEMQTMKQYARLAEGFGELTSTEQMLFRLRH